MTSRLESSNTNNKNVNRKSRINRAALQAGAIVSSVAAFAGIYNHLHPSDNLSGKDLVYIVKPGDIESSIAQLAYPELDNREVADYINSQEPAADRSQHMLHPGEKIYFRADAFKDHPNLVMASGAEDTSG